MSDLSVHGGPTLTPVTHSNKAVAVGAVLFYVDHFVTGRISKFTYGASGDSHYHPSNREHVRRKKKTYLDAEGERRVPGHFRSLLLRVRHPPPILLSVSLHHPVTLQGTKVLKDRELRTGRAQVTEGAPLDPAHATIIRYTGMSSAPEWIDIEPGNIFSSDNVVRGTHVKQTNLRYCVVYRQIYLLRRVRRSVDLQARCPREGVMI